jgi:hypothetical protein
VICESNDWPESTLRRNSQAILGVRMMATFKVRSSRRVFAARPLTLFLLLTIAFLSNCAAAQTGNGTTAQSSDHVAKAPQSQGVVSTAGAHAAVLDADKRPITAGGFVESGPIVFQDIAEKAGLTRWRHVMGTPEKTFIQEPER